MPIKFLRQLIAQWILKYCFIRYCFFFFFFAGASLFALAELQIAPAYNIPLATMGSYFNNATGVEIHARGTTRFTWLQWIEKRGFYFAAGLAIVPYSMRERQASKLTVYQLWGGVDYPLPLPYGLTFIPRLGVGAYYGNYLKSGRNENLSIVNPLIHTSFAVQYFLTRELSVELAHGYTFAYMGNPTWFSQAHLSLGVSFKIGVPADKLSPASQLRDDIAQHYDEGDYVRASKEIDALEKITPDDLIVEKYRSLIYQQKKYQEAKKQYAAGKTLRAIALLRQVTDIPEAQEDLALLRG
ncbi:MAG TPA: hypothetical protein PLY93_00845, partial [Turneriella sp.]|nr:hypothetical protein [Turneriella sp.]